jgi:hypothetical protein
VQIRSNQLHRSPFHILRYADEEHRNLYFLVEAIRFNKKINYAGWIKSKK